MGLSRGAYETLDHDLLKQMGRERFEARVRREGYVPIFGTIRAEIHRRHDADLLMQGDEDRNYAVVRVEGQVFRSGLS